MEIILRIQQQGIIRPEGYQVTQWAVTIPILVPPLATSPLSYADLFLTRGKYLERVAKLIDFQKYPAEHLLFMEVKGANGGDFINNVTINDVIKIQNKSYWLQETVPPYNNNDFIVEGKPNRVQGLTPKCYIGNQISLSDYVFTNSDIGRWINLSGFSDPAYNGLTKINGVLGLTANVDKTFSTNAMGSSWNFPWVQIQSNFVGLEPRYFPTTEYDLSWKLFRGGIEIFNGIGGVTSRNETSVYSRTKRFTSLMPTLDSATALMDVTANQVASLQREAALNNTNFTTIITRTYGP